MTAAQHEAGRRLAAAGAARGVVELVEALPLAGRGGVDSGRIDDRELLRACVSALAYLARQLPPAEPAPRRPWWRRRSVVEPFVAPLDELVEVGWEQRVRAGSGVRWRRVWDTMRARDAVPWPTLTGRVLPVPAPDPVGTDLLRRVNQALATASGEVRAGSSRLVRHRPSVALGVPTPHLAWAVAQAEREGVVVPSSDPARARRVPVAQTLARAMEELSTYG